MNKTLLVALLAILIVGAGVGTLYANRSPLPDVEPLLTGFITREGTNGYLVETDPTKQWEDPKCWARVQLETKVYWQEGDRVIRASAEDLAVGQLVRVWTFGAIAESYPCFASGDVFLILEPPSPTPAGD